jgi:hypothetical protein
MSKLMERLRDASRSGVYRTTDGATLLAVVREGGWAAARVSFGGRGDKAAMLDAIARSLAFPQWFGGNWDALEDCLADLSWRAAGGHVLLFEDFALGDELGILIDILGSVAEQWAARGTPFFAIFADPAKSLPLADLYRER